MIGLESIISPIVGLVSGPLFNFLKLKFLKPKSSSPQDTLSSLAITNPNIIDKYVIAQAELLKAQKDYFNRDVIGEPSKWVVDLRASIRPIFVVFSILLIIASTFFSLIIPASFVPLISVCLGNWFGSRTVKFL
jgi:hypothetical protein